MIVLYADTFRRLSRGDSQGAYRVILNVNDDDPRRGFSVFERVFKRILFATLVGFVMCYFMNVQNLYLQSSAPNIWAFLSDDLIAGFSAFLDKDIMTSLSALAGELFDVEYIFNIMSVYAVMMVFGFFASVALSMAWTLSQTAERSRDYLSDFLRAPDRIVPGVIETAEQRDAALQRLARWDPDAKTGMVLWPFGWPALRQLMLFLAFGCISLVLYKIGLFFAGVAIAWVTVKATGIFSGQNR